MPLLYWLNWLAYNNGHFVLHDTIGTGMFAAATVSLLTYAAAMRADNTALAGAAFGMSLLQICIGLPMLTVQGMMLHFIFACMSLAGCAAIAYYGWELVWSRMTTGLLFQRIAIVTMSWYMLLASLVHIRIWALDYLVLSGTTSVIGVWWYEPLGTLKFVMYVGWMLLMVATVATGLAWAIAYLRRHRGKWGTHSPLALAF